MILMLLAMAAAEPVKLGSKEAAALTEGAVSAADGSRTWVMDKEGGDGLSAGVYAGKASVAKIDSYATDEFMLVLKGRISLRSDSGNVTRLGPGDAVFVPKGWKGTWDASDYRKFYVLPK